jgi:hypothetical protein
LIVEKINRRPYGSKVDFLLSSRYRFGFDGETSLLINEGLIIRFKPQENKRNEGDLQRFSAFVEGFATAGEAEQAGLRFAMALLWTAVSLKFPLRLEYHTPLPCVVYDRTPKPGGMLMQVELSESTIQGASTVVELIEQIFVSKIEIDKKLLLSMELFAGARLEVTERTKFIGLVSALEPLALQRKFEQSSLSEVIQDAIKKVQEASDLPGELKASLTGQLQRLSSESVSQAIYRLVKTHLPANGEALATVKEAYNIRSKMLHEGSTDADLDQKSSEIEDVIRRLYAAILEKDLYCPPGV